MIIIDFHTHAIHEGFNRLSPHVQRAITIPLGMPKGWTWQDMTVVAGMNPKPDDYVKFLRDDLPSINAYWYQEINRSIAEWVKIGFNLEGFFIFVPWISLSMDINQLKGHSWFSESKIAKIIPVFDDVPPANQESWDDNYIPKLHKIVGNLPQKVIMIHTGWGSSPVYYNNLIGHYPDKIFILAHMKEDDDSDNTERQAIMNKYSNAYLEMSYLSSPKRLAQYVAKGWGDRILFGSDYRSAEDECTLEWMISAVKLAPISNEARNRIFYENARELLQKLGISGN